MLCKKCGGVLSYSEGQYICDSCGNQYAIKDIYEDIDTYICYMEEDEVGRRTKDSILAQDIYHTLERAKIKTFYARVSADGLTGGAFERACNAAIYSAKTVLILGTQKRYFEQLIEKYSALYAGKIIIPVYADMGAYDIPKGISAIQALDYNKVGASVDLAKSICNALGREQGLDYTALTRKAGAKKKTVLWMIVAVLAVAILAFGTYCLAFGLPAVEESAETTQPTLETTQATLSPEEVQENQYAEAVASADSGDYVKAIELFLGLSGYKDSDKQLSVIYQHYAGYYRNEAEAISFRLQVWDGDAAGIELSKTISSGAQCMISESFQLQGSLQSFGFNDSENNQGQITLELINEGIVINVDTVSSASDISVGSMKVSFLLDEKSDKPFAMQVDSKTLQEMVRGKTTLSQLRQQGFELELEGNVDDRLAYKYRLKNTNILFALSTIDDDPIVVAISAPANIIIPDKIGAKNDSFEQDGIIYVPDGEICGDVGTGLFFGFPENITHGDISGDTNVCFTGTTPPASSYEFLYQLYIEGEMFE